MQSQDAGQHTVEAIGRIVDNQLEQQQRLRMLTVKFEKPADQRAEIFSSFMGVKYRDKHQWLLAGVEIEDDVAEPLGAARKGPVDVAVAAKTDAQIDPMYSVQVRRDVGKPDRRYSARHCDRRRNAVDVGDASGAEHLTGELARRPNLLRDPQHAPHVCERVLRT